MTKATLQRWLRAHADALLTAVALPVGLLASAPSGHWSSAWEPVLAVAAWLPLTVRTRWPLPVTIVVVVLDSLNIVVTAHGHPAATTIPVATMLALYTVGRHCSARVAWATALVTGAVQCAISMSTLDHREGQSLLYLNWAVVTTVIGRFVRERQHTILLAEQRADEAEQALVEEAQRQVTNERLRIARELHDVLAHHITVVNAQAGVAQYLLRTDLDAAETALAGITDNTTAALDDLRVTLGLLRSDQDDEGAEQQRSPAPGLGQLPALLASFSSTGADVRMEITGRPQPLSGSAELAIYRIVQEALTNAAKHAPGSGVQVRLEWSASSVGITVTNSMPTSERRNLDGGGHGLIGLRERALAAGGTLSVGPTADNGFAVSATIPTLPTPAVLR